MRKKEQETKAIYTYPTIEVLEIAAETVICASGDTDDLNNNDNPYGF